MPDTDILVIDDTRVYLQQFDFGNDLICDIQIENEYIFNSVDTGYYCKVTSFPIDVKSFKIKNVIHQTYSNVGIEYTINNKLYTHNFSLPFLLPATIDETRIGFSSQNISQEFIDYTEAIKTLTQANAKMIPIVNNLSLSALVYQPDILFTCTYLRNYLNIYTFCNGNGIMLSGIKLALLNSTIGAFGAIYGQIMGIGINNFNITSAVNYHNIRLILQKV